MFTKRTKSSQDSFFMRLALMQAKKAIGNTKMNPSVGCVIVKKNKIIGVGSTGFNGIPHAEHNAINFCKENLNKASMYITLEPCSNYGKTPPCVNKIINNNVKKVSFSIKDPDIRSFNKCAKKFKENGILVKKNILSNDIKNFYKSYINYKKQQKTFVTAKLAISKDHFTKNSKNKWITNSFSRGRVHIMRSINDCILTSSKTILEDDPSFNCRIKGFEKRNPSIIILDKNLKLSSKYRVIKQAKKTNTYILFNKLNKKKIKYMKGFKVKFVKIPLNIDGNLDLNIVLSKIARLGFSRVFLESGIKLMSSFLKMNLVNDFKLFISKDKINKNGLYSFNKMNILYLKNKKYKIENINLLGDKLLSYRIK